jgi:hypothetical protein
MQLSSALNDASRRLLINGLSSAWVPAWADALHDGCRSARLAFVDGLAWSEGSRGLACRRWPSANACIDIMSANLARKCWGNASTGTMMGQ